MAYVSQEKKSSLAPAIKAVLNKYKVKASIAVRNHSTLVVNIKEGEVPFNPASHYQVNEYHYENHYANNPTLVSFLSELLSAMKGPEYYNNDNSMIDYYERSHYTDINFGKWDQPYKFISK
jgi:hypothetical protein